MISLSERGISSDKLTLHVGAGTFKPVISETIDEHEMHFEKIIVKLETIENILANTNGSIVAVGTTSVRTLESLYWHSIKLMRFPDSGDEIHIKQWDPYLEANKLNISQKEA